MEMTLVIERRASKLDTEFKQEKLANSQLTNKVQALKTAYEQFTRAMAAME